MLNSGGRSDIAIPLSKIVEMTSKFNISREDILRCIQEYSDIAVWTAQDDRDGNPVIHFAAEDIMVS